MPTARDLGKHADRFAKDTGTRDANPRAAERGESRADFRERAA